MAGQGPGTAASCVSLFAGRDWSLKTSDIAGRFHLGLFGTRSMPWISF